MKSWLLSLLLLAAQPAVAQQSLHSRESMRAAVDQYVQAYMSEKAAEAAAAAPSLAAILEGTAQDGDRSELDALAKLIDASLDKHEKKDFSNEALQRELGKLTTGGRSTDRLLAKLGVTSSRVAGAGQAIHGEMVAWLVARYYDRPEERDALFSLISKFSDEVQPEVRARVRDVDDLIHYLSTGTSIGMTAVMIFDFRRHILDFGKNVSRHGAEAWQGLRTWTRSARSGVQQARPGSVLGLELSSETRLAETIARERQAVSSSNSALTRWEGGTQRAAEDLGRASAGTGSAAAKAAAAASARDLPATVPKHRGAAQYMGQLASQVARGFVIGGVPAGIHALNEQSDAAKIDPLRTLRLYQLLAISEIEMAGARIAEEGRKLAEELEQPGVTEAKRKDAREKLKVLAAGYEVSTGAGDGLRTRHVVGLNDLRSQYEHLQAHASNFKGLTPYPDTMKEIAAYRSKLGVLKLLHWPNERITAFLSTSRELEARIATADERIRAEAAKRGFTPSAKLAVSLAAAEMQLMAVEHALRALNELAKPAK